jgi:hypothetical protein
MQIDDWKQFYDSLNIELGGSNPLRPPTKADLDAYEAETGLKLRHFSLIPTIQAACFLPLLTR